MFLDSDSRINNGMLTCTPQRRESEFALIFQSRFFLSLNGIVIIPPGCYNVFMIQIKLNILDVVAAVKAGRGVVVTKIMQCYYSLTVIA
jgi:hypothetical protein